MRKLSVFLEGTEGSGSEATLVLNLDTTLKWVVSLALGKHWICGWLNHGLSGRFEEAINFLLLPGFEAQIVQPVSQSLQWWRCPAASHLALLSGYVLPLGRENAREVRRLDRVGNLSRSPKSRCRPKGKVKVHSSLCLIKRHTMKA